MDELNGFILDAEYDKEVIMKVFECKLAMWDTIYNQKRHIASNDEVERENEHLCQLCGQWELKGTQLAHMGDCEKCGKEWTPVFPVRKSVECNDYEVCEKCKTTPADNSV